MKHNNLFYSIILLVALLGITSCEKEKESNNPENSGRTWRVSINAGPADETKAISVGGNSGQILYHNWDQSDAVQVVKEGSAVGTLTADVSAGNSAFAKLGGTLTGTFAVNDEVTLYYHSASLDYTGQVGTIAGVSADKSYLKATSTVQAVNVGSGTIQDDAGYLSMSDAAFSPMQAYLDLTFVAEDGVTPLQITRLDIWADGGKLVKTKAIDGTTVYATEAEPLTITPTAPASKFFLALRDENGAANDYHFKATRAGGYTFEYNSSKNLEDGHFYTGTVSMDISSPLSIPLTFEAKKAGATVSFRLASTVGTVEYSTDGNTWTNYTSQTDIPLPNIGDKVMFRGDNASYYNDYSDYSYFSCTRDCYLYGNIMSLISSTGYATLTELTAGSAFQELFYVNEHILNHDILPIELPATTLTPSCYSYMFSGCTGLTAAPALPALIAAEYCYHGMFSDCENLLTAPNLPAMTLSSSCYGEMFSNCTSLTSGPNLPALIAEEYCYYSMFERSGLITAPSIAATTLAYGCYQCMFEDCTSLTTAPVLPATTLANSCYYSMFEGCTSLTTAPALPATTLAYGCYSSMFEGCTSLVAAPTLSVTTLTINCYSSMFEGCTSLTTAPTLPATTLSELCYYSMFEGCTSLTTAPALPATTLSESCYYSMFKGCTSLTTAPTLPATTLADGCYRSMFEGCTSLTMAPTLPAPSLVSSCYREMFKNCSSLSSVTCFATSLGNATCRNNWLSGVAATGTFIMNATASPSPWSSGASGIPSGWTVIPVLPGQFSVSNSKEVFFSQGNLQWSGNNGWRFAPSQYDYIGNNANNTSPTVSDDNYMDLFCWGATGLNGVAPNTTGTFLEGSVTLGGNSDWGACNITNGGGINLWHTLRRSEWTYVFDDRLTPSGIRYAKATVNGISGVILLPDNWDANHYALLSTNTADAAFSSNDVSLSDWTTCLEVHGAVFLPAAGFRMYSTIDNDSSMYWSSSDAGADEAGCLSFGAGSLSADSQCVRSNGLSVRLVRDIN